MVMAVLSCGLSSSHEAQVRKGFQSPLKTDLSRLHLSYEAPVEKASGPALLLPFL